MNIQGPAKIKRKEKLFFYIEFILKGYSKIHISSWQENFLYIKKTWGSLKMNYICLAMSLVVSLRKTYNYLKKVWRRAFIDYRFAQFTSYIDENSIKKILKTFLLQNVYKWCLFNIPYLFRCRIFLYIFFPDFI